VRFRSSFARPSVLTQVQRGCQIRLDTLAPVVQSSNYAKFQTRNPVVRRLIDRFYARLGEIVGSLEPASVLDAGCGEGETLARLASLLPEHVAAADFSAEAVEFTAHRLPTVDVRRQSVLDLQFADGAFELVLCLEVLEHLDDPPRAVTELARVSSRAVVISVPHEPWFRIGSMLRGKYIRSAGNHPEHINHWNRASLRRLLERESERVEISTSFPWLIAFCASRHRN
jgi:2-polyprenyl-3-methyl-5-hydroxy-6-metoxy-1,4-benzoquinol methylase